MKKLWNRTAGIALLILLLAASTTEQVKAQNVEVSYQTFYDDLSPYGQWVTDGQYGNVWVPNEGGDFRPYGSRGHWVMTDYGNTWVSDDPWGWACYHYGRWTYDDYYGWVWIPGYEWAPAWVSWRYGNGYSGWAPLGPGVDISYTNCPQSWWIFVQPQYMYEDDCYRHWRGPQYNGGYIRQTSVVNYAYVDNGTHVRYNYGPRADVIQRDTHQPVHVYHLEQSGRPGAPAVSGNNVSMYRPQVNRATANTARPANAMAAPRQIGRPQAATTVSASHQPAFRQQVQQQGRQPQAQPQGRPQQQAQPQGRPQQAQPQGRPQQQTQPQQRPQQQTQPQQRPQPMQQQQRPQQTQPEQRPQPMPQQQRPQQPQTQQRPQPMPQQQRPQQPQPQQRPQPMPQQQRPQQPQPQQRPQPMPQQQRPQQPQPQQRPQPMPQHQRPQPMPQQRPQPMPQQRPQPMPQQAPHSAPPHEEGGRR